MRSGLIVRKLLTAITAMVLLIYFMGKTTSPKIFFVPFLLCSIASIGKNLGLLFNKRKFALYFDILFEVCFFLFWFGFLAIVCYVMIRDSDTRMLPLTVPFWLAGIYFAKRKIEDKKKYFCEGE